MLRLTAQLLLPPVCLRFPRHGRLLWIKRVIISVIISAIMSSSFKSDIMFSLLSKKKTGRFSSLSRCRDRSKPIHLFAKNSWTRWSPTLSGCYPIRANLCLSSSSYPSGVSRLHLFSKDWKSRRGRDARLLCPPLSTSTGTDTNTSFQSKNLKKKKKIPLFYYFY